MKIVPACEIEKRILRIRGAIALSILIVFIFCYGTASTCTIFNGNRDDMVLVGNNEDGAYSTKVKIWFVPATEKGYGRVCFGWNRCLFFPQAQGGMNDQGLFFDWALCPKSHPPTFSFRKRIGTFGLPESLLAQCSTVDEAIQWLRQYTIPFIRSHIMLVDRSGDSAVVEWVDGEMKILRKKNDYKVITNFWLSHPELGNYPCGRYDTVRELMENPPEISIEYFASILKMVSQHEQTEGGKECGTIYSTIYDLANGEIYIYYKRDFENPIKLNLERELKKGNHSYTLESFFMNNSR
ncbi:MAG: carcinine hydrolase/isopenicillin-N N-acyltransferase family protein [bacterium]